MLFRSVHCPVVADTIEVLSLVPLGAGARARIEAVDPRVRLTSAPGWFDGEIADTWGPYVAASYLPAGSRGSGSRAERDALLAGADVVLGGFPVPVDVRARAPRLRWFHQTPAGASNLHRCDLWGSDVVVTTSRGLGNTGAIAEYVVASFLHFAREFHRAGTDRAAGAFRQEAARKGPFGFPVVDISVTLVDGGFHTVDSSDMAFKTAAQIGMREGAAKMHPVLLEPILRVSISTPSEATARINQIVSGRRGQLLGYDGRPGWDGWDVVEALIPQAEMDRLIIDIRSATQGVGTFTQVFDNLAEVTGHLAAKVLERAKATADHAA